jgi:Flp pilus assembly protein TadD
MISCSMKNNSQLIFEQAKELEKQGKLEEAIVVYNEAIKPNCNNPEFYRSLGECLQKTGKHEEAIYFYEQAIEIQPVFGKAHHNLGNALSHIKQWDAAIYSYKKAIEINPNSPTSYYRLGEALKQKKLIQEAIVAYKQAIKLNFDSSAKTYNQLGDLLIETQQWEEAAEYYSQAFNLDPNFSPAYYKWRSALDKIQKLDEYFAPYAYQGQHQLNLSKFDIKILYILPVRGGSGGAHSVFQECLSLNQLGFEAKIAVNISNYSSFIKNYPSIENIKEMILPYQTLTELKQLSQNSSIVCATTFNSVKIVDIIARDKPDILPAYYIQDYEPLFYQKDEPEWLEARESYTLIPHAVLFAKTQWLCDIVQTNHAVQVHKVEPSLDHQVYYPNLTQERSHVEIAMMIRFATPRRGPRRTAIVAKILSELFPDKIHFTIFGADEDLLKSSGIPIPEKTTVLGHLTREEVANVLRNSDIFLDLSDYQAFGRTALEAMACGCIPVVPERGGAFEFAIPYYNALVIDTTSIDQCVQKISELIQTSKDTLLKFKLHGIETASRYSNTEASLSIVNILFKN